MIKVGVVGANGKMGATVVNTVLNNDNLELCCAIDKFDTDKIINGKIKIETDLELSLKENNPDIVVDFTQPSVIFENIKIYMKLGIKSVIGTTGLTKEQILEIEKLSKETNTGIIIAPNFSIGAILMMEFAAKASKYFSNAEIIEYHHNQKKDAPSGTALLLADSITQSLDNSLEYRFSRHDLHKKRNKNEIGFSSIRGGNIVGEHTVKFFGLHETFEISHISYSRSVFADGALKAAEFLINKPSGLYGMDDLIDKK